MTDNKIAIVAPCHIPPGDAWIHALKAEADADHADVIIIDDSDGHLGPLPEEWIVLGYEAQEKFLGELYLQFAGMFHKSSACRVLGHIFAYANGYEVIIGLDSDCIVKTRFIRDHTQYLNKNFGNGWFNPIGWPKYSRGYPYSKREWPIKANMGLWENVLDINGKDREANEPTSINIAGSTVPAGFFPFSGMNWAMTRDSMWGFLFLPNFNSGDPQNPDEFRRIDDVWGGYIYEKLMQKMQYSTMLGYPFVFHDTVVDAEADAREEEAMYKFEDAFIAAVDEVCNMMALHINHGQTSMAEVMEDFIINWGLAYQVDPFHQLDPAFEWWGKVIKKYA